MPACSFDFSKGLTDVGTFLATSRVLENTGVMAYDGAIRFIENRDLVQAGATIATVEARHAAYFNLINRASPFPDAFDTPKKPSDIITAVLATGFVTDCPPLAKELFARLP